VNTSAAEVPTLAACLTPPGTGAIATVAVRGSRAWPLAQRHFRPRRGVWPPETAPPGRFWLGRIGDDSPGRTADDVVLTLQRLQPTGWIEVHCHGGREVVRWLLQLFAADGVEVCSWQELELRTSDDPGVAVAEILVEAPTWRTASILLDQYHGAFRRAFDAVREALAGDDGALATRQLEALAHSGNLGRHLVEPWSVVVLGPPNVGKSSLVNALAGYQRSVVAPTPGTTRDVVTLRTALDGWPVELADTAGLRDAGESLEEEGIRRARDAARAADLCLWVLDASAPPIWPTSLPETTRLVVNKIDLAPAWDFDMARDAVAVSAHTGQGMPELCEALSRWLVPEPPPAGAAVPYTPSLASLVEDVHQSCRAGRWGDARRKLEDATIPT
jgi:tRNA modification GTPase